VCNNTCVSMKKGKKCIVCMYCDLWCVSQAIKYFDFDAFVEKYAFENNLKYICIADKNMYLSFRKILKTLLPTQNYVISLDRFYLLTTIYINCYCIVIFQGFVLWTRKQSLKGKKSLNREKYSFFVLSTG